jgi:hypothetical protein
MLTTNNSNDLFYTGLGSMHHAIKDILTNHTKHKAIWAIYVHFTQ